MTLAGFRIGLRQENEPVNAELRVPLNCIPIEETARRHCELEPAKLRRTLMHLGCASQPLQT